MTQTLNENSRNDSPVSTYLLPVVPLQGVVPSAIDKRLGMVARTARTGDRSARNAVFAAYMPRLQRLSYWTWKRFCQGSIVALEDVQQEAFLVFDALLRQWSGNGSFSSFLLGSFHWRLRDAVLPLVGLRESSLSSLSLGELAISSFGVEQALHLLDELSRQFAPLDRQILLLRYRDGRSVRQIASELKVNRRTVQRRLATMRLSLRKDLLERTGRSTTH